MVNAAPGFNRMPQVINGFSELILRVFGLERGAHARSAVGLDSLPFGEWERIHRLLGGDSSLTAGPG